MTGRKMMMVAVLLANSVKQAMKAVMKMTATGGGTCARGCKWLPIHTANPDSYSQSKTYGLLIHQFQEAWLSFTLAYEHTHNSLFTHFVLYISTFFNFRELLTERTHHISGISSMNDSVLLAMFFQTSKWSTSQPLAIAKPPPSSKIIFHGTHSWAFLHDNRGTYAVFEAAEKKTKMEMNHDLK